MSIRVAKEIVCDRCNASERNVSTIGTVLLVCSPRPRPQVHSGRTGGNQWWRRDTHHVSAGSKTLCGRKCEGWIEVERRSIEAARNDMHLCVRCASKLP